MNQADVPLHAREVRRLIAGMGIPLRDLDDLVQEALEKIWANRQKIDPSRKALAWIYEVARNVARKYLRRQRSHPEELIAFEEHEGIRDGGPDPEATALLRARLGVLRHLIKQIDVSRRAIFVEHVLLEVPLADIAASHRISPGTVSKRLSLAGEDLRAAAARWQAVQRRRGGSTEPAIILLLLGALDLRAWASRCAGAVRRLDARRVALAGAVAIALGAIPRAPWPRERLSGPACAGLSSRRAPPGIELPPELHDAPPASAEEDAPPAPARTPRGAAGPATYSTLEDELVGGARAALAAGNAVRARQLLEDHARAFPAGQLARERDALLSAPALH